MKLFTRSVELRFSGRTLLLFLLVLALGVTAVAAVGKYQETKPRRLFPDEDLAKVESVTLYPVNQWAAAREMTREETAELLAQLAQTYYYGEAYLRDLEIDGGGSGNYGLDYEGSDVDTKLIVTPTFEDIAMNRKPISTTHVRENDEHIDFKDVRLMLQTFKKQNMNFLEILFTEYKIINPRYAEAWGELVKYREEISHLNTFNAVKAMKGVALEKFHAMEHRYPAKIEIIDRMGYDPKQLHHLLRVEDYLQRYIAGVSYEECLRPANVDYLKEVKMGKYTLEEAREVGKAAMTHIEEMCEPFTKESEFNVSNERAETILDIAQYEIMRLSVMEELYE